MSRRMRGFLQGVEATPEGPPVRQHRGAFVAGGVTKTPMNPFSPRTGGDINALVTKRYKPLAPGGDGGIAPLLPPPPTPADRLAALLAAAGPDLLPDLKRCRLRVPSHGIELAAPRAVRARLAAAIGDLERAAARAAGGAAVWVHLLAARRGREVAQ